MKKSRKKTRIAIIVLVVFFLMNMVAANIVFHIIFARYDYSRDLDCTVAQTDGLTSSPKDITFKSKGKTLVGKIYYADAAKGNLIIVHGLHSYGDRYLPITEYFVENNWNVITYDMTGTGDSEGSYTVGLSQMTIDLHAAIDFVQEEASLKDYPIALWGHSMGGYAVAAVLKEDTDISGAVTVSAFDCPTDIMKADASEFVGDVVSNISYPFMWLQNVLLFGRYANIEASEVLADTSVPTLVVYGNSDDTILPEYALYTHKDEITNDNVEFYLVEEEYRGEHSTLWLTSDSAEYALEIDAAMDSLDDEYDGNIPVPTYEEFLEDVDIESMYELDVDFMEYTESFLSSAIEQ